MRSRHTPHAALVLASLAFLAFVAPPGAARAQGRTQERSVTLSASSDIYAGLPFTLLISAQGFDEEPTPEVSEFSIPGCTISYVGVSPNVSTSISIFNGRRTETRTVEFSYRYRVTPQKAGDYRLPAITVTQDGESAASRPASFTARDVATTRDMRVALILPGRPVTVGETFEVTLDWYLRKNPQKHEFSVPLFDAVDWVDVHQPQVSPIRRRGNSLTFTAGDQQLVVPYDQSDEVLDGVKYTRLRFQVDVTPIKAGTLELAAARVVAELPSGGTTRDSFGFPVTRTQLFKAEDTPRSLEIQPLPLAGRPPSFANAIGTAYGIEVRAARTVVELGEPLELEIVIRGDGRLEGLSLPPLDNAEGLPPEHFTVPDTPVSGEIVGLGEDSNGETIKGKRFRVMARIKSPDVREVPAIGFSFYNPTTKTYETVRSEPIALSVANRGVVGSESVVRSSKNGPEATAMSENGSAGARVASLVGADLSLSAQAETLSRPWSVTGLGPLVYLCYALPLLLLGLRIWQLGTRARREDRGEVKKALAAVRQAVDSATNQPAREAGPRVLAALRALARTMDYHGLDQEDTVQRIENESYSPEAGERPLADDLTVQARELATRIAAGTSQAKGDPARGSKRAASASASLLLLAGILAPSVALAGADQSAPDATPASVDKGAEPAADQASDGPASDDPASVSLERARAAYQEALSHDEREARTAAFARSERLFRELVRRTPDSPELLTDWGNAALGAQELGRAMLAYRRVLALSPRHERAQRNLAWVRERMPDWLPRPEARTARDSLFFWHHSSTLAERHLIAGLAFALAILLLVPWCSGQRLARRLAILPAAIWVAMMVSIVLDDPPVDDAVVMRDDVSMLSANNAGAPRVLARPLPAGTEVRIVETRDAWAKIALADGTAGWVQSSAVERVLP